MSGQPVIPHEIDFEDTLEDPSTAGFDSYCQYLCEMAQLYGVKPPGIDEFDTRDIWLEETIGLIPRLADLIQAIALEGTQIGDDLVPFWSGIIGVFHRQAERLQRQLDDLRPRIEDYTASYDGTEISGTTLELALDKAQNLSKRIIVWQTMRDYLAKPYNLKTNEPWRPARGSYRSRLESGATIEGREFIRALDKQKNDIPDGFRVVFSAPLNADEYDEQEIVSVLDNLLKRHPDLVLIHSGNKGGDEIAVRWATRANITDVRCSPEFDKFHKAAPFQRNRDMLDGTDPEFVVYFKAKRMGIQSNLLQEAESRNIQTRNGQDLLNQESATS